jgi:hypothetical protein
MSDIALHGLEAMLRGALLGAVVAPAGLWAAWRAGAGLPRRRRIGLAVAAAYCGVALAAIAYAPAFERTAFQDEALFGALVVAIPLLLLTIPFFLIFTPRA